MFWDCCADGVAAVRMGEVGGGWSWSSSRFFVPLLVVMCGLGLFLATTLEDCWPIILIPKSSFEWFDSEAESSPIDVDAGACTLLVMLLSI